MMIMLWGLQEDEPITVIYEALQRLGASVFFLDQRDILQTTVEMCIGSTIDGVLRVKDRQIHLDEVTAFYLRPYDSRCIAEVKRAGEGSPAWEHACNVDDILLSWAELTPALVVNQPTAMAANNSKPYQAAWIQALGFQIPETLLTTDPEAVLAFWQQQGEVIYKSISGTRSIVSRLTNEHKERLDRVTWCPTQFQQYVPGNDYRVHVVGEQVFACRIVSRADDYRYAHRSNLEVTIHSCELPDEISERCKRMVQSMHLSLAGVDLRLTPDNQWYCFEVNPSPAFTYYQQETQQPIDEAIALLLMHQEKKVYASLPIASSSTVSVSPFSK